MGSCSAWESVPPARCLAGSGRRRPTHLRAHAERLSVSPLWDAMVRAVGAIFGSARRPGDANTVGPTSRIGTRAYGVRDAFDALDEPHCGPSRDSGGWGGLRRYCLEIFDHCPSRAGATSLRALGLHLTHESLSASRQNSYWSWPRRDRCVSRSQATPLMRRETSRSNDLVPTR
jgi:hypothetical protein